ncbi:TIGR04283 family arsenosugar biosynthesis glycosyltransferase [Haliea atlantica]
MAHASPGTLRDDSVLSFVIPMLNEAANIGVTLAWLAEHFPGAQRIVVDGGSGDGSVAAALPLATEVLIGERGRARQMDLGARVARGEWLLFLHADTRPLFSEHQLRASLVSGAQWGFCRVELAGAGPGLKLVQAGINLRSRASGIGTGDQMLWIRRDVYRSQGGFAGIPLMEDVELCRRLRRHCPPRVLPLRVSTSARRWRERGVMRTVLEMWGLRLAFFCGVSPQRLHSLYYGRR